MKDIFFYLNRLSEKSDRLIGHFTSNLAESWMHMRCKFDGGNVSPAFLQDALESIKDTPRSGMVPHGIPSSNWHKTRLSLYQHI